MKNLILILTILVSSFSFSQSYSYKKKQIGQPGSMYFFWGYNRSIYTKSDINFTGDYYNFTIHKALAHDKPVNEFKTYIDPTKLTIPQFNFRVGYYLNKKWDVSVGWDHMKYVMTNGQEAKLTGQIPESENDYLNGEFNGEFYRIHDDIIHYENSNGLNYIRVQLTYNELLYQTNNRKFAARARFGIASGPIMTQTDFIWSGKDYHTNQKITGFGISAHTGARLEFFNRFFAQTNFSTGFIALPHLQTIAGTNNYARQKFVYGEWQIVAGAFWFLKFKNGCDSCPDWH
jgi:hypothetical protein